MGEYAKNTTVDSEQSRVEIERILDRYGATEFAYFKSGGKIIILFEADDRRIKFELKLPEKSEFETTDTGRTRKSANAINEAYEQAVRQRWRALALVIKAKLESVQSGIETFEEAFMANILLPGNQTVSEWLAPQIQLAYDTGSLPPMLPSGK